MHSAKESFLHRLQFEQYPQELCSIQPVQTNIAARSGREEESQPARGLVREVKILSEKLWYNGFKLREIL